MIDRQPIFRITSAEMPDGPRTLQQFIEWRQAEDRRLIDAALVALVDHVTEHMRVQAAQIEQLLALGTADTPRH